jgi:hypothetical protein
MEMHLEDRGQTCKSLCGPRTPEAAIAKRAFRFYLRRAMEILPSRTCRAAAALALALLLAAAPGPRADAAGRKRRDPNIAIRFHLQTNTYDPTFAAKVMVGNPPKQVVVEKLASISELDIASFYPYRAADGSYAAAIQLDAHGRDTLEAVSLQSRGSSMLVAINGHPLMLMTIDKEIKDGIIFIPSSLTEAQIRNMGESFEIMGHEGQSGRLKSFPQQATPPPDNGLPKPVLN